MNELTNHYRQSYLSESEKRSAMLKIACSITGYLGAYAKYDESVPSKHRIAFLEHLIKTWLEYDADSSLTQQWVEEWKVEIEKIKKENLAF